MFRSVFKQSLHRSISSANRPRLMHTAVKSYYRHPSYFIPTRTMCRHLCAAQAALDACKGLDSTQTEPGLYPDSHANDAAVVKQLTRPDPSSFANSDIVKVLNYHLDLAADFDSTTFKGCVVLTVETVVDNAEVIVLDIRDVNITSAASVASGTDVSGTATPLDWWVTRKEAKLGQAVVVRLPAGLAKGAKAFLKLEYSTAPTASALQWLRPEQTEGKQHPYLFSQCQAIHARSLLPCHDTPGVKTTYSATLRVPAPLQALMTAILDNEVAEEVTVDGKPYNQFRFTQAVPIPIYLIGILIGNLKKRDLSPRSAVWSEPEVVDKAAWEFEDIERILGAAEKLCGPYQWGRYDLAVLPPAFLYGGMESQLTFVTPSLLAGDRSLVNVIAHEAAHSWSGNLVTNNDWQSFFLNEGFTVFIERKILEALEGVDFKGLHTMIGWEDLKQSVADFADPEKLKFTALLVDLSDDADPDDAFSSVPYEKGFALLSYLEKLVGGSELMNKFLKAYFDHFKYQSIAAKDFTAFFLQFMTEHGVEKAVLDTIDWNTWLNGYGLPPKPDFSDVLAREAYALADDIISGANATQPGSVDMASWSSTLKTVFLDKLIDAHEGEVVQDGRATAQAKWAGVLARVELFFDYAQTSNSELLFRWLTLQVRNSAAGQEARVGKFLTTFGRMKFCRPLYRDLFKSERYRAFGEELFTNNRGFYHNICATMIGKDLADAKKKDYVW